MPGPRSGPPRAARPASRPAVPGSAGLPGRAGLPGGAAAGVPGSADRQQVTRPQRRGTEPDSRSADRLPSTAGTSMPPRTAR